MIKFKLFIPIICISVLLTGCAATYHAAGEGASGFRDLQVEGNVFYVEYTEGLRVEWAQIHRFALKRCAEITKTKGYKFFDVISKDEKTVYLKSNIDQIIVSNMGNLASDVPISTTYDVEGKKVEGRRVTYRIKLMNE